MSVSLPFNIYSAFGSGGFLQFLGTGSGTSATLGLGGTDAWQKWFLQLSGDGIGVAIENLAYGSYIAALSSLDWSNSSVLAAAEPRPWYLAPPLVESETATFSICDDEACSMVLAPLSQVDSAKPDSTEVALTPATGAPHEYWEFIHTASASALSTSVVSVSPELRRRGVYPRQSGTSSSPKAQSTSTTITAEDVGALNLCPPCGKAKCQFEPTGAKSTATYSVLIGQPVSNCNSYSHQVTKTTLGGTYTLTKSFGVEKTKGGGFDANVGTAGGKATLSFGPSIYAETKISSSKQEAIQQTQSVEVNLPPGQIGA